MSDRGSIKVFDADGDELWFYCHDGQPELILGDLDRFVAWVEDGTLRDNVSQSAGWLIVLGAHTMRGLWAMGPRGLHWPDRDAPSGDGWKVGAIEPAVGLDRSAVYQYHVDLSDRSVRVLRRDDSGNWVEWSDNWVE